MSTIDIPRGDVTSLRRELAGTVVTPADPDWDQARLAWNLQVDQRPELVVWAESSEDVAAVVRHAATNGLRVAPQGTGHGACTLLDLSGTILLKTSRMKALAVDPAARRARVEAGVLWQELAPVAAEHGLAGLSGSAGDIGIVGYSLGGGIGWLGRRYGLACNSIVAVELVTADGQLLRVDADNHPDLFWALRGGGGSFGIVTALEIALYPVAQVHAGMLLWPIESTADVARTWARWTRDLPDAVTSLVRVLRFPAMPELPPFLSGRELVVVEAAFLDGRAQADALLAELRALGPELDTFADIAPPALAELHMDPPTPVPGDGDGMLLRDFGDEAVEALVRATGPGAASALLSTEVRHLGGAFDVARPEHGALGRVEGAYMAFSVGMPATPQLATQVARSLAAVRHALAPFEAERAYLNLAEQPTSAWKVFGRSLPKLLSVRAMYDPDQRFLANHPVR